MDLWQSCGNANIKLIQGIQGTGLAGKEKTEYKTIYDNTYTFLIQKLQHWGKRHLKINFSTHTISLLVIYGTDNHKQLLQ